MSYSHTEYHTRYTAVLGIYITVNLIFVNVVVVLV